METTQQKHPMLARFARAEGAEAEPAWLRDRRERGRAHFEAVGFPTPNLEAWKNTNLRQIAGAELQPAAAGGAATSPGLDWCPNRLVFVDGRLSAEHSTALGEHGNIWAGGLSQALADRGGQLEGLLASQVAADSHPMAALNTGLFEDLALIVVSGDAAEPLHVAHIATGNEVHTARFPRLVVVVEDGARLKLIESYFGEGEQNGLTCAVAELRVGENGSLDHYRVQQEQLGFHHLGVSHAQVARHGRYAQHNFQLGSKLARLDNTAMLDGEGAHCLLNGLYVMDGTRHVDNNTTLEHAKPHGDSREVYKGVLGGDARAVFTGRIKVHQDAQKTDAKQSNPNLLLTDGALVHTRPQLEIYADDVKCTHGATIGRLDADALFYLRSRGIPESQARQLLVRAFAGEMLEPVDVPALHDYLDNWLTSQLDNMIRNKG